jgi:8-oxo-dGTP pyrophosphatase MutT (NUDIX family)
MAEALVRELGEELGIRTKAPGELAWETMQADGLELNLFVIDSWDGEPQNMAPEEHDDIRWVAPDEMDDLDLANRSYVQLLRRALE